MSFVINTSQYDQETCERDEMVDVDITLCVHRVILSTANTSRYRLMLKIFNPESGELI